MKTANIVCAVVCLGKVLGVNNYFIALQGISIFYV